MLVACAARGLCSRCSIKASAARTGGSAMVQKTMDAFVRRPPPAEQGAKPSSSAAAATPAAAASNEAAPAPDTAGDVLPASPEALHAAQVSTLQQMRMHANRNMALGKQVVIRAEQAGTMPKLSDLLVEESWKEASTLLGDEMQKPYFKELERFVQAEWAGGQMVFPPKDAIFRALNSCPVDSVRVVVLGQDPYHDLGQGMGLSFSVPQGKAVPSSLRNMYKELKQDCGCEVPTHGNLEKWAHQGVLLLNAVLTVRAHQPASHAKKGWEKFTDEVIARLSRRRQGLVFLLWGRYAQAKGKHIGDGRKHQMLTAAHPSGLSASRGFFGCRHFSKTNELLQAEGQLPIDWCID